MPQLKLNDKNVAFFIAHTSNLPDVEDLVYLYKRAVDGGIIIRTFHINLPAEDNPDRKIKVDCYYWFSGEGDSEFNSGFMAESVHKACSVDNFKEVLIHVAEPTRVDFKFTDTTLNFTESCFPGRKKITYPKGIDVTTITPEKVIAYKLPRSAYLFMFDEIPLPINHGSLIKVGYHLVLPADIDPSDDNCNKLYAYLKALNSFESNVSVKLDERSSVETPNEAKAPAPAPSTSAESTPQATEEGRRKRRSAAEVLEDKLKETVEFICAEQNMKDLDARLRAKQIALVPVSSLTAEPAKVTASVELTLEERLKDNLKGLTEDLGLLLSKAKVEPTVIEKVVERVIEKPLTIEDAIQLLVKAVKEGSINKIDIVKYFLN